MNKKGLQLLLIVITVLLVMAVPFMIESGVIPIKNKIVAYTVIFVFMILVSFAISFGMKKYNESQNSPTAKRLLYDNLMQDYNSKKIEYNLARSNVNRHDISVNSDNKLGLTIDIKKGDYNINLNVTLRKAMLNIKENEENLNDKYLTEAERNPNILVRYSKDEIYELLIKLYKSL